MNNIKNNTIISNKEISKVICFTLKICIVAIVFLTVIIGSIKATADGYSNWITRLLYYTSQSNIWIGVSTLLVLLFNKNDNIKNVLYRVKYCFTSCIVMTATVFYLFLAPFAKGIINIWSPYSVLFHGVVPLFAFLDFILDNYKPTLNLKDVVNCMIPPLVYFSVAIILCYIKTDFGLGTPYPYLFLDVYSPAGMFGAVIKPYFWPGTFYWIIFFGGIMFLIELFLMKINNKLKRRENNPVH